MSLLSSAALLIFRGPIYFWWPQQRTAHRRKSKIRLHFCRPHSTWYLSRLPCRVISIDASSWTNKTPTCISSSCVERLRLNLIKFVIAQVLLSCLSLEGLRMIQATYCTLGFARSHGLALCSPSGLFHSMLFAFLHSCKCMTSTVKVIGEVYDCAFLQKHKTSQEIK